MCVQRVMALLEFFLCEEQQWREAVGVAVELKALRRARARERDLIAPRPPRRGSRAGGCLLHVGYAGAELWLGVGVGAARAHDR